MINGQIPGYNKGICRFWALRMVFDFAKQRLSFFLEHQLLTVMKIGFASEGADKLYCFWIMTEIRSKEKQFRSILEGFACKTIAMLQRKRSASGSGFAAVNGIA